MRVSGSEGLIFVRVRVSRYGQTARCTRDTGLIAKPTEMVGLSMNMVTSTKAAGRMKNLTVSALITTNTLMAQNIAVTGKKTSSMGSV